jgi:hypothetical protein
VMLLFKRRAGGLASGWGSRVRLPQPN